MARCVASYREVLINRRAGYWNPKVFPTVAAFASMSKSKQDEVVVTCKRHGFGFALEIVPKSTVVEQKGEK